jgi:hypothetical protein
MEYETVLPQLTALRKVAHGVTVRGLLRREKLREAMKIGHRTPNPPTNPGPPQAWLAHTTPRRGTPLAFACPWRANVWDPSCAPAPIANPTGDAAYRKTKQRQVQKHPLLKKTPAPTPLNRIPMAKVALNRQKRSDHWPSQPNTLQRRLTTSPSSREQSQRR